MMVGVEWKLLPSHLWPRWCHTSESPITPVIERHATIKAPLQCTVSNEHQQDLVKHYRCSQPEQRSESWGRQWMTGIEVGGSSLQLFSTITSTSYWLSSSFEIFCPMARHCSQPLACLWEELRFGINIASIGFRIHVSDSPRSDRWILDCAIES